MDQYLVTGSKELGTLLRSMRRTRGLTQAALAARAGILPKTVSAIESGMGQVLVTTLMRCLSALELELFLAPRPSLSPGAETSATVTKITKAPRTTKARNERW